MINKINPQEFDLGQKNIILKNKINELVGIINKQQKEINKLKNPRKIGDAEICYAYKPEEKHLFHVESDSMGFSYPHER